jgi:hypothetical protein
MPVSVSPLIIAWIIGAAPLHLNEEKKKRKERLLLYRTGLQTNKIT